MRVALCLHGHFRTFADCAPNLYRHILEPYKPDVFAMAWMDSMGFHQHPTQSHDPHRHPGYDLGSPGVDCDLLRMAIELLRPIDLHLDHWYLHEDGFAKLVDDLSPWHHPWPHHRPKGTLSLCWTRYIIMRMRKAHELQHGFTYDRVICTRYDMDHTMPINLLEHDPGVITLPNVHGPDVTSDVWASGPADLMDAWAEQFHGRNELISSGNFSLGTHEWMKAWFEHRNIPWQNRDDLGVYTRR